MVIYALHVAVLTAIMATCAAYGVWYNFYGRKKCREHFMATGTALIWPKAVGYILSACAFVPTQYPEALSYCAIICWLVVAFLYAIDFFEENGLS